MDDRNGFWQNDEAVGKRRQWEEAVRQFMEQTKAMAEWVKQHAGPPVGIFGSARGVDQIEQIYHRYGKVAAELGRVLGEQGYTLVTGACPGMPALVERSFRKYRIMDSCQPVIGIRIELAPEFEASEPDSATVDLMLRTGSFGTRTELMEMNTDGGIFLPGGIGTELEMHVFAQLEQLRRYTRRGGPIILVGRGFWQPICDRLRQLENWGTVSQGELQYHMIERAEEALPILEAFNSNAVQSARIRELAKQRLAG